MKKQSLAGWYQHPDALYHSIYAINSSMVMRAYRSLYTVVNYKEVQTKAMIFGSAVHLAVLQPEKFKKRVVEKPKFTGKGAREAAKEFETNSKNLIVLSTEEFEKAQLIAEAVRKNQRAQELLTGCIFESAGYLPIELAGEHAPKLIKIKPDARDIKNRRIIDLKTTKDASYDAFSASVVNYLYHLQAAFYLWVANRIEEYFETGIEYTDFYWIAVEKEFPFQTAVYHASPEFLRIGAYEWDATFIRIAKAFEKNEFPSYEGGELLPPAWFSKKYNLLFE